MLSVSAWPALDGEAWVCHIILVPGKSAGDIVDQVSGDASVVVAVTELLEISVTSMVTTSPVSVVLVSVILMLVGYAV